MMVTGILNLAFASLGLLMGVWGLIQPFIPMPGAEAFTDLYKDGTFLLTVIGLGLIGMATKGLMWFSGLGLVKGKAFGRSLGNLWAPISMVYGLTSAAVQGAYILPKTFAAQQAWMQAQPNASSQAMQQQIQVMQTMSDIMIWGTVVMGVLTALVYQIIFLILNNRKPVKDYLAAEASGQTWDSAPAGEGSRDDSGGDASPW